MGFSLIWQIGCWKRLQAWAWKNKQNKNDIIRKSWNKNTQITKVSAQMQTLFQYPAFIHLWASVGSVQVADSLIWVRREETSCMNQQEKHKEMSWPGPCLAVYDLQACAGMWAGIYGDAEWRASGIGSVQIKNYFIAIRDRDLAPRKPEAFFRVILLPVHRALWQRTSRSRGWRWSLPLMGC